MIKEKEKKFKSFGLSLLLKILKIIFLPKILFQFIKKITKTKKKFKFYLKFIL